MQIKNTLFGIGLAGVLATTGCASWDKSHDRSVGRVVDDKHITGQVEDALAAEPVFKLEDVGVKTYNGTVQLNGFVSTQAQKDRAGDLARRIQGVARVENHISIKHYDPLTPTGRTNVLNQPYVDSQATNRTTSAQR